MRAEIRSFHCPDYADSELSELVLSEDEVLFNQVFAGAAGEEGEESFNFLACTPTGLQDMITREGPRFGRGLLIVPLMKGALIAEQLQKLFASVSGESWDGIGQKLNTFGHWEFDGIAD